MKAVGYKRALPIDDPESLLDLNLPERVPEAHDLLVDVKAVSVTARQIDQLVKTARGQMPKRL